MSSEMYPHLFSELELGRTRIKNRICIPGHATRMSDDGGVLGDRILAYHEARAAGGVGMIVTEVNVIHPTYAPPNRLSVMSDDCIPGLNKLAKLGRKYDCRMLGQLFHPGRVAAASADGSQMATYSASEIEDETYKNISCPLDTSQIWELIDCYAQGARRMAEAELDGIEIVSSMGYLISQFLNPRFNHRTDEFGGSLENRMRFAKEIISAVRREAGDEILLGIRLSADEMDEEGLGRDESLTMLKELSAQGGLDYLNIIAGSTATYAGFQHIVPHMVYPSSYIAPMSEVIRREVDLPVLVAARVNQPQEAEEIIASGQADIVGMVRANICDPEFANKAKAGRSDDIRACIACNQACIGHGLKGFFTSCIQFPETGRELQYGNKAPVQHKKKVMVIGGGPAGMKAAAVAAERGHETYLYEKEKRLGGQALLAQLLPDRTEFGGIATNLQREVELQGVQLKLGIDVDRSTVDELAPDVVILATGAEPQLPDVEGIDGENVVNSWSVINGEAKVGNSVVIWDWRSDWVGLGLAQMLAEQGCGVRLAVNGMCAGERLPPMVRDYAIGKLHKLGVEVIPYAKLFGVDETDVYLQHAISKEPIILDNVDTLVTNHAPRRNAGLKDELESYDGKVVMIGDCLSPRSAEEAVLEGLKSAMEI